MCKTISHALNACSFKYIKLCVCVFFKLTIDTKSIYEGDAK